MLNFFLNRLYAGAGNLNDTNVFTALARTGPHSRLLDIGCWDGKQTKRWAQAAKATEIFGIEPVSSAAEQALKNGIQVSKLLADSGKWPYKDDFFDCIISNQVVEHLTDLDHFFSESSRVLKPGGHLITSTNNLSSWHNIISLVLGWTPFDLSNSSAIRMGLGNPLAIHRQESNPRGNSWTHKSVYTSRWLTDWQAVYGLSPVETIGAGYYPFPAIVGKILPLHSAFITVITQKNDTNK